AVRRTGLVFGLTHNYTGYPLVRQAREMVAAGELGPIRVVQVEYVQDWLSTKLEDTGHKQAGWRVDPQRAGAGGCLGDIGTHAYYLAEFVTGLHARELAADLGRFVAGRMLDDNDHILLRYEGGARGMLWASQVAPGNENGLRLPRRAPAPRALRGPTVEDGARGVKFIAAAVDSHAKNGAWVDARVTV